MYSIMMLETSLFVVAVLLPLTGALTPPHLVYTATGGGGVLIGRDLDGGSRVGLLDYSEERGSGNCAQDVDYDMRRKLYYWTDVCEGKIRRAAIMDGRADAFILLERSGAQLWGIAVDWVHNKLFYTDIAHNEIDVYDVATNTTYALFVGLTGLRDIAVDPLNGWIYWIDGSKIERANLDGDSRETINNDGRSKSFFTIDILQQKLYWTSSDIYSMNTDGSNLMLIDVPFTINRGVAYYNGNFYFANYVYDSTTSSGVYTTYQMTTDGTLTILGTDPGIQPRGHRVVALSKQPVPLGFVCEQGLNNVNCDINAICSDIEDSNEAEDNYICTCKPGFTGDGMSCEDIDECEPEVNNCHEQSLCVNTEGSFSCTCYLGFTGNGMNCEDIDECTEGLNNCHLNALCTNTEGDYTCSCNAAYTGDGLSCEDIDECELQVDNCDEQALCVNTAGSFSCTCNLGFTGNGMNCEDIDECAERLDNCHLNALCTNAEGSYTCSCSAPFTGDGRNCTIVRKAYPAVIATLAPGNITAICPTDEHRERILNMIRQDISTLLGTNSTSP